MCNPCRAIGTLPRLARRLSPRSEASARPSDSFWIAESLQPSLRHRFPGQAGSLPRPRPSRWQWGRGGGGEEGVGRACKGVRSAAGIGSGDSVSWRPCQGALTSAQRPPPGRSFLAPRAPGAPAPLPTLGRLGRRSGRGGGRGQRNGVWGRGMPAGAAAYRPPVSGAAAYGSSGADSEGSRWGG